MKKQYFITSIKSKYGARLFTEYDREKTAYIIYYAADDYSNKQPRKEYKRLSTVEKYIKRVLNYWNTYDKTAAENIAIRAADQIPQTGENSYY